MNHGVPDLLRALRGGLVSREMDRQLSTLIEACRDAGKKGTMTIKLTFDPHGRENKEIHVVAKCTTTAPVNPDLAEPAVFFAVRGGQLVRDNPQQETMQGLDVVDGGRADGSSPAEQTGSNVHRMTSGGNA